MDYLIGLVFGYYLKQFFTWIKDFAEPTIPEHYKEDDWDWIK
tara:strand:- start:82 stop:207 length:126 start_codon:yes stop_codon:yes gene_type:complete